MASLDLGVCDRQRIGAAYSAMSEANSRAEQLLQGELALPPHATWVGDLGDWAADPYNDRNWRFQRHTLRWLMPLVHGGRSDKRYANEYLRLVRSWVDQNTESEPTAPETWMDMATGTRAIALSLGAFLVPDSELDWYTEVLLTHKNRLTNEKFLGRGNHALHQHQGLIVISALLRDAEGVDLARLRMVEQFDTAFDSQGANDEGSANYHQLNVIWWKEAWSRLEAEQSSVPEHVKERLDSAVDTLAHLTLPSGYLVQIGDGARTLARSDLDRRLEWVSSGGRAGESPKETLKVLDRGYILSRSDWSPSATFIAVRFGERQGYSHAHEDRGSVYVHSGGNSWLVDSGFSSYQRNDPVVKYLKSERAHNLSYVVGVESDVSKPVRLESLSDHSSYRCFTLADFRYPPHLIRRRIYQVFGPDIVLVVDDLTSKPHEHVSIAQRWVIDSNAVARYNDRGFTLVSENQNALMHWFGRRSSFRLTPSTRNKTTGWVYPRWKTAVESPRIVASASGNQPVIAMLFARNTPEEIGISTSYLTTKGVLVFTILRGPRVWRVKVADSLEIEELERSWIKN